MSTTTISGTVHRNGAGKFARFTEWKTAAGTHQTLEWVDDVNQADVNLNLYAHPDLQAQLDAADKLHGTLVLTRSVTVAA